MELVIFSWYKSLKNQIGYYFKTFQKIFAQMKFKENKENKTNLRPCL